MTKFFIPTFEQALEITQKNECFTHRIREYKGVKISIFDYLLAQYPDFKQPIPDKDYDAFELRGLCFIHHPDGSMRRFLALHKFFNYLQCEGYQKCDVQHKAISCVMDKMDGSMMRFVKFPDGEIVVKSKTFFDNDQTKLATSVYEKDTNLQAFVRETIDQNLAAIFELTSPINKIVVGYKTTELTLLQLRDENTGEYFDIYSHPLVKKYNIKCTEKEEYSSLEELLALKETIVNKEGWIVCFEDGQMLKIKGQEYCRLHGLYDNVSKENFLMEKILENTIDDIIAELAVDDPRRPAIELLTQATNHYIIHKMNEAKELAKKYTGDRKTWAMTYRQNPVFFVAAKVVGSDLESQEEFMIKQIQNYVRGETNRLERARNFILSELKCKLMIQFQMEDEG